MKLDRRSLLRASAMAGLAASLPVLNTRFLVSEAAAAYLSPNDPIAFSIPSIDGRGGS